MSYDFDFRYSALVALLLCLTAVLMVWRPRLRSTMVAALLIGALAALLTQPVFGQDYWTPKYVVSFPYLMGCRIGVEDLLYGAAFSSCVVGCLPGYVKKERHRRLHGGDFLFCVTIPPLVFMLVWRICGWHSFYAYTATMTPLIAFLLYRHREWHMLARGACAGLAPICLYPAWNMMFPGITEAWWKPGGLGQVILLRSIPLNDLLWAVETGILVAITVPQLCGVQYTNSPQQ